MTGLAYLRRTDVRPALLLENSTASWVREAPIALCFVGLNGIFVKMLGSPDLGVMTPNLNRTSFCLDLSALI